MQMIEKVGEAVKFLQSKGFEDPEFGIILGTGLGALADEMKLSMSSYIRIFLIFQSLRLNFIKGSLCMELWKAKKWWLCREGFITMKDIAWDRWFFLYG